MAKVEDFMVDLLMESLLFGKSEVND